MFSSLVTRLLPVVPQGIVRRVAGRYIAGETTESAIALAAALARDGFVTTIDVLGEDIVAPEQATATADAYVALMRQMHEADVERNVSLKLTQLGLRLDEGRAFAELERILAVAELLDFFVRIDMEDSSVTDVTLELHERARRRWPRVGAVLQARLRRTVDDARRLAATGADIRLCKGIYQEPAELAYTGADEIRDAYVAAFEELHGGATRIGIATHDRPLIERIEGVIAARGPTRATLEFQALLGVPIRATLERLRDAGYPVRIYVPFGDEWYAYSVRRLRENPQLAGAIVRGLFSRDRLEPVADGSSVRNGDRS